MRVCVPKGAQGSVVGGDSLLPTAERGEKRRSMRIMRAADLCG